MFGENRKIVIFYRYKVVFARLFLNFSRVEEKLSYFCGFWEEKRVELVEKREIGQEVGEIFGEIEDCFPNYFPTFLHDEGANQILDYVCGF